MADGRKVAVTSPSALAQSGRRAAAALRAAGCRVVLAESCTAGLVAATLAQTPGISDWLCGSAVVYREATKQSWLGVAPRLIARHSAVSAAVTEQLARSVLARTPEATAAVAVTGHLGPDAPPALDGAIFIATAFRQGRRVVRDACRMILLTGTTRTSRQREAAGRVLDQLVARLSQLGSPAIRPPDPH